MLPFLKHLCNKYFWGGLQGVLTIAMLVGILALLAFTVALLWTWVHP